MEQKTIAFFFLGNPTEKYTYTRHNAGFLFGDFLKEYVSAPPFAKDTNLKGELSSFVYKGKNIIFVKPQTYMNKVSGCINATLKRFALDPSRCVLVFDDLDIPLGYIKTQFGSYPKVHNGVLSAQTAFKTDVWAVRIGIDKRNNLEKARPANAYVLSNFSGEELKKLHETFVSFMEKNRLHELILRIEKEY